MFLNKIGLAAAAVAVACVVRSTDASSIYEIAAESANFTTLADLLVLAELDETLCGDEATFTVFAPTNSAFAMVSEETLARLSEELWKPQLQDILLYHVIQADPAIGSADLVNDTTLTAANGQNLTINTDPPRVNGESIILVDDNLTDIEADNGIIHGISPPLLSKSLAFSVVDIVALDGRFSTLVEAVQAAGLLETLGGEGPFTIFAPTDEAFDKLPNGTLDELLKPKNLETLTDILKYHVIAANKPSSSLRRGRRKTLNGDSIKITITDDGVMINSANVIDADMIASNGFVHAIDAVLIPPESIYDTLVDSQNFTTLADLVKMADLEEDLSGETMLTLFAPVNSAFDELPTELVEKFTKPLWKPQLQDVLLYHLLEGRMMKHDLVNGLMLTTLNDEELAISDPPLRINGNATIVDADIEASNGIIHGISGVLAPASVSSNILDIAKGDDQFSILVEAVMTADLSEALMGDGPLTIFAPTNEAFEKLPEEDLDKDALINILTYHVVEGNLPSSSLSTGNLKTLNGEYVSVVVSGADVTVNDANVVDADIIASNGIVHAINAVLIPQNEGTPTKSPTKKPRTRRPTRQPRTKRPTRQPRTKRPTARSKSSKSPKSPKSSKSSKSSKGSSGKSSKSSKGGDKKKKRPNKDKKKKLPFD